jgi:hypothetical protein
MLAIKKNLKDGILDKSWNAIMYCPDCGSEYSANSGDYWNVPKNYRFKCCDKTMKLIVKKTIFTEL